MQKSTVAGILSIVAGALGVLAGLMFLIVTAFASSIFSGTFGLNDMNTSDQQFITVLTIVYGVLTAFFLIIGALGIVGGIFSIQRKRWGWALAAAIAGCLTFLPLGIGAVVLVAMARSEFTQHEPGVAPQPPANNPA